MLRSKDAHRRPRLVALYAVLALALGLAVAGCASQTEQMEVAASASTNVDADPTPRPLPTVDVSPTPEAPAAPSSSPAESPEPEDHPPAATTSTSTGDDFSAVYHKRDCWSEESLIPFPEVILVTCGTSAKAIDPATGETAWEDARLSEEGAEWTDQAWFATSDGVVSASINIVAATGLDPERRILNVSVLQPTLDGLVEVGATSAWEAAGGTAPPEFWIRPVDGGRLTALHVHGRNHRQRLLLIDNASGSKLHDIEISECSRGFFASRLVGLRSAILVGTCMYLLDDLRSPLGVDWNLNWIGSDTPGFDRVDVVHAPQGSHAFDLNELAATRDFIMFGHQGEGVLLRERTPSRDLQFVEADGSTRWEIPPGVVDYGPGLRWKFDAESGEPLLQIVNRAGEVVLIDAATGAARDLHRLPATAVSNEWVIFGDHDKLIVPRSQVAALLDARVTSLDEMAGTNHAAVFEEALAESGMSVDLPEWVEIRLNNASCLFEHPVTEAGGLDAFLLQYPMLTPSSANYEA